MSKVYYKGDLDLLLTFLDSGGSAIQWPRGVDWELKLWCDDYSGIAAYVGERAGKTYGCSVGEAGHIHIKTDNPGLGIGPLKAAMRVSTPDTDYSDERRDVWNRLTLSDEVRLVAEGVVPTAVKVEALMPFFPVDAASPAEAERIKAEQKRAAAEADRIKAEAQRAKDCSDLLAQQRDAFETEAEGRAAAFQTETEVHSSVFKTEQSARTVDFAAEQKNRADDYTRAEAERVAESKTVRDAFATFAEGAATAEQARATAESGRKTAEEGRETAESGRKTAEEGRETAESGRKTAEEGRAAAESGRKAAEEGRVTAETARAEAEEARAAEFAGFGDTLASKQPRLRDSADITVDTNTLAITDKAKRQAVIDMWKVNNGNDIAFGYDEATGLFSLNVNRPTANDEESAAYWLNDITYAQAIDAMRRQQGCVTGYDYCGGGRLVIPPIGYIRGSGPVITALNGVFSVHDLNLELCVLHCPGGAAKVENSTLTFTHAEKLRAVIGRLYSSSADKFNPVAFTACYKLEYFRADIKANFNVADSPLLTLGTMQYLVAHAANTDAITVTVHPTVYGKLTDEANADWHKVLTDAAAKKISFATINS